MVESSEICTKEQLVGEKATSRAGPPKVSKTAKSEASPGSKHTRGIINILEPNLEWVHDAVGVMFAVQLVHGEAIPVLDGTVAEGEAEYSAKLCCGDSHDHFG
jgi:hypothetical protein